MQWLQGTLLGTVATTVAVIAVASVGLSMLSGRTNLRHGLTVIIGCFLVFGATGIAGGIRNAVDGGLGSESAALAPAPTVPPPPVLPPHPPKDEQDDPYAGAAVHTGAAE